MRSPTPSKPAGIVQLPNCVSAAPIVVVPALLQITWGDVSEPSGLFGFAYR